MKELLFKNVKLKLLALGFSFALWFFVAGQTSTEVGFIVPLAFKGIPKDMVMTGAPMDEVDVRVVGPKFLINNLLPSQIIAEVDMRASKEGVNGFRILPRDVNVPMGIKVTRVLPSALEVRLERLVDVDLPVRVRLKGTPAAGWRVAGTSVVPKTVTAGVLKKQIDGVEAVYTRDVDVGGLRSTTVVTAQLEMPGNGLKSISADTVRVKVVLEKERK